MQLFDVTTPIGATMNAALRMWQEASAEERREYQAFSSSAGHIKPLSQIGIDSLCQSLRYYGGSLLVETGNPLEHHSLNPITGPDSVGGISPAARPWTFAGARDGELCYGVCEAGTEEAARDEALRLCAEYHDLDAAAEDFEGELDGFAVWQPLPPAIPGQLELLRIADDLEAGEAADIYYDCEAFGDEGQGEQIESAQSAMTKAARILRSLPDMREALAAAYKAGVRKCHPAGVTIDDAAAKGFEKWIAGEGAGFLPSGEPAETEAKETASEALRARVLERFAAGDDLEIDDNAAVSRGDTGLFVQAWAWVPIRAYEVKLEARGIDVTASDLVTARKYAAEDAEGFKPQWNYTVAEVEEGGDPDGIGTPSHPELELEKHDGETYTFTAAWWVTVEAETEEEARAAALEQARGAGEGE